MNKYFQRKIAFARSLTLPQSSADYGDVCIILCAVLSACAAIRWPGKHIDRARFIEMLIVYSKPEHRTDLVSIPVLLNDGIIQYSDTPYSSPGEEFRIFLDEEIDLRLTDAKTRFPSLDEKILKEKTYASLIYEWVRCGYAHEYRTTGDASHVPASEREARVSYIIRGSDMKSDRRMMSFHLDYLFALAEHHVAILPDHSEVAPGKWWIH